ncbi:MAG: hypothetical protein ACLQLG_17625 [Thermoguttaceae bacterium]
MTAVQWWCSGAVLNTVFGASNPPPRPRDSDAAAKNAAAGQESGPSAAAAASQPSGATFDRVA